MSDHEELDAGAFGEWIAAMQAALRGQRDADVPCGDCSGCCTSSQFVHIGPDESDVLTHVPDALLASAPGLPGHQVLGFDDRGRCPMLVDGRCSIYAHRPRTCRTYDCRVFAAAGVALEDPDKSAIADRARRWRFRLETVADQRRLAAVRAAAQFVEMHPGLLPADAGQASATDRAVIAVEVHEAFATVPERSEQELADAISTFLTSGGRSVTRRDEDTDPARPRRSPSASRPRVADHALSPCPPGPRPNRLSGNPGHRPPPPRSSLTP
ncbi:MAG: YkgJ family cysteine cluster protein [Gaiellales bacterium]